MGAYITPPARLAIFKRDGWRCYLCGRAVAIWLMPGRLPPDAATLDHVVPICRGGDNSDSNLKTACAGCNGMKGARTPEEFKRGLPKLTALVTSVLSTAQPGMDARQPLRVTLAELLAERRRAA